MDVLKILLVVFHITVAAGVLGASFGWARLLRKANAAGLPSLRVAVEHVASRLRVLRIASFMTLFTGVGLIFTIGGFAIAPKNYHIALTVMLVAIGWNLFFLAPKVKALGAVVAADSVNADECSKLFGKIGMGTGVLHAVWLALLTLMYVIL